MIGEGGLRAWRLEVGGWSLDRLVFGFSFAAKLEATRDQGRGVGVMFVLYSASDSSDSIQDGCRLDRRCMSSNVPYERSCMRTVTG